MKQANNRAAELTDTELITVRDRRFTGTTRIIHAVQEDAQAHRHLNLLNHASLDALAEHAILLQTRAVTLTAGTTLMFKELHLDI